MSYLRPTDLLPASRPFADRYLDRFREAVGPRDGNGTPAELVGLIVALASALGGTIEVAVDRLPRDSGDADLVRSDLLEITKNCISQASTIAVDVLDSEGGR